VVKTRTNLAKVLLKYYLNFLRLFNYIEAKKLPLHQGKTDHYIKLEKVDKKEPEVLYGRIYNILRDELLVL
jgi:hypothetical protein